MLNSRGKTLTIFLVLILVLLVASTSIGFFLYNKEIQARKQLQTELDVSRSQEEKLQGDLKEIKHQLAIAQDKNKEADEKINNLIDEIDLNEGVRKQIKAENASLKEALDTAKKEKDKIRTDVEAAEKKYKQVQELLKTEQDKSNNLQSTLKYIEEAKLKADAENERMKADLKAYNLRTPDQQVAGEVVPSAKRGGKLELDKIVVNPNDGVRGRVLSVDKEAEFVVCNIGLKNGIKSADVMSVYRGEEYLGDVKVSRVQEELCAADLIPPFSSRKVRKNDIVVFKP